MTSATHAGEQPLVRISNVWKKRGANMVLKGVDLDVLRGKVVCLLGPSPQGRGAPNSRPHSRGAAGSSG